MAEQWQSAERPGWAPAPQRSRRRWVLAAAAGAAWMLLFVLTHSMLGATVLVLLLAAFAGGCLLSARTLGGNSSSSWLGRLAGRPGPDDQDGSPAGPLPAGARPGYRVTRGREYPGVEAPPSRLTRDWPGPGWAERADRPPAAAPRPAAAGSRPAAGITPARSRAWLPQTGEVVAAAGYTPAAGTPAQDEAWLPRTGAVASPAMAAGLPTMAESCLPQVPELRLVTGGRVTKTSRSGALAGRGEVELVLPAVSTVSREHARFTYTSGQWWVANLGRNGLTLNGTPLAGAGHAIRDGDSIRWGHRPDAPVSRVEIG